MTRCAFICASKRGVCHLCLGRRFYYPYDGCAFVKTKRDIYPLSHLSITETRLSMRQLQCSLDAHYMCVKTCRLSLVSGSSFLLSIRWMCAFVKTKRDIYPLSHLSITETRLSMRQLQCSLFTRFRDHNFIFEY